MIQTPTNDRLTKTVMIAGLDEPGYERVYENIALWACALKLGNERAADGFRVRLPTNFLNIFDDVENQYSTLSDPDDEAEAQDADTWTTPADGGTAS